VLRGWRSCLVASPKQPPHPPRPPCLSARRRRTRRPSWRPSRRSLGGVTHTQRQPGAHTTPASPHRPRPGDSRLRPGLERGLWPCKLTPDHTLILFLPLIILPRRLRIGESIFIRRTFISLADGSIRPNVVARDEIVELLPSPGAGGHGGRTLTARAFEDEEGRLALAEGRRVAGRRIASAESAQAVRSRPLSPAPTPSTPHPGGPCHRHTMRPRRREIAPRPAGCLAA
jgi:hypothetical protein